MRLVPDSKRYVSMAEGRGAPRPFCYRWLLPALCGASLVRWRVATVLGVLLTCIGIASLCGSWWQALAGVVVFVALPMTEFNLRNPVLTDSLAIGLATVSAALFVNDLIVPAVLVACVAGMVKESAPVFAALFAFTPWLLLGLIPVFVHMVMVKPGVDVVVEPGIEDTLRHPFRTGVRFHKAMVLERSEYLIAPWGGLLIALTVIDVRLALCVAVAYGQLLMATDTVRLYQWCAPLVIVYAVACVPAPWLLLLVLSVVFNPFRGDGVYSWRVVVFKSIILLVLAGALIVAGLAWILPALGLIAAGVCVGFFALTREDGQ